MIMESNVFVLSLLRLMTLFLDQWESFDDEYNSKGY